MEGKSNFLTGFLTDAAGIYGDVMKAEANAEAEKYKYLNSQPKQPTSDPNAYREAEPVKGQDSDGTTLVALPNRTYGGLPVWGWGLIIFSILMMVALAFGRRGRR